MCTYQISDQISNPRIFSSDTSQKRKEPEDKFDQAATTAKRQKNEITGLENKYHRDLYDCLQTFTEYCVVCHIYGIHKKHRSDVCPQWKIDKNEFFAWKGLFKYSFRKNICYWCHVPHVGDFKHMELVSPHTCPYREIVLPACYFIYQKHKLSLEKEFDTKWRNADGFRVWLGQPPDTNHPLNPHSRPIEIMLWYHKNGEV